jgi:hypothetical protein
MEAVIIKVCGDAYFFHRLCIESWWLSATPSLNTCPIDRALCYDNMHVGQSVTKNVEWAEFLGHDPHARDTDIPDFLDTDILADPLLGRSLIRLAKSTIIPFPGHLLQGDGDMEVLDFSGRSCDLADVADIANASQDTIELDEHEYLSSIAQATSESVHDEIEELDAYDCEHPRPWLNDAFADLLTRGLNPVLRARPFSAEADPEAYQDCVGGLTHLVDLFDDNDLWRLTPQSPS